MRTLVPRVRLWCCTPECPARGQSWTIYGEGEYPRRKCRLALVVIAVRAIEEDPGETLSGLARRFNCHRRTVARLLRWAGGVDTIGSVTGKCTEIDPGTVLPAAPQFPDTPRGMRPGSALAQLSLARHLVLLLEHLAGLLRAHEVGLEDGPGLVALLREQFHRWGEIFYVTRAPPALRIPWPPGTSAS